MSLFTIKIETRGGLSVRVFLHRIVFNLKTVMSLPLQAAQTFVGNIGWSSIKTLHQPPFKFFWFFSPKEKNTKNFPPIHPHIISIIEAVRMPSIVKLKSEKRRIYLPLLPGLCLTYSRKVIRLASEAMSVPAPPILTPTSSSA